MQKLTQMNEPQQKWTETIESHHSLFDLKLKEVWRYKDLIYMFVKRDFISSFKQTILGPIWFFINPIFTTITYLIIFGRFAKLPTDELQVYYFISQELLCGIIFPELCSVHQQHSPEMPIFLVRYIFQGW